MADAATGMIGFDTETELINAARPIPRLVCLSWCFGLEENACGLVHWSQAEDQAAALLDSEIVGAFTPFDLAVLGEQFPRLAGKIFQALAESRVHDVLTREKLIDIALGRYNRHVGEKMEIDGQEKTFGKGYSLAASCFRRLGVVLEKDKWRLRYGELRDTPVEEWPEGARTYAADDAISTWALWQAQEEFAASCAEYMPTLLRNECDQVRAHWALHLMTAWGIRTSPTAVQELYERTTKELEECKKRLEECGLVKPNGVRDTKLAKKLLVEKLGTECKLTDTGEAKVEANLMTKEAAIDAGYISLDEESCLSANDPRLQDYQRYGALVVLRSKEIEALQRGTVVAIHSRFEEIVETGRTSSSDPNIQNVRREPGVRECFVPRDGHVFVACDYDKAELVSLAEVCLDKLGQSRLADFLCKGFDPHTEMAAQILGIKYEEALARLKAEDPILIEHRQMAKAANFGFPGGLGPRSFVAFAKAQYNVNISEERARQLRYQWFKNWPEMQPYFEWINGQLSHGLADMIQLRSERIRGKCFFTVAANTMFQGLTADAAKAALWEVTRKQYCDAESPLFGTHVANFIHDEIIVEAPEERGHEVAFALRDTMVSEYNKYTRRVPVSASPVIMKYWSKKAKQVWQGGRLVPWPAAA